ncbi:cupin, partial [Streptomyces sp. NPDC059477]
MTATEGLLVPPGHGRVVQTPAQHVTFKVTGSHSRTASTFEVLVPPGFDGGGRGPPPPAERVYVQEGEVVVLAVEPPNPTPHPKP